MPDQPSVPAKVEPAAEPIYKERGGVLPPFAIRRTRVGNDRDTGIFDSKEQLIAEVFETVARERLPGVEQLTGQQSLQERINSRVGVPVRIDSTATARLWVCILNAHWNDEEEA